MSIAFLKSSSAFTILTNTNYTRGSVFSCVRCCDMSVDPFDQKKSKKRHRCGGSCPSPRITKKGFWDHYGKEIGRRPEPIPRYRQLEARQVTSTSSPLIFSPKFIRLSWCARRAWVGLVGLIGACARVWIVLMVTCYGILSHVCHRKSPALSRKGAYPSYRSAHTRLILKSSL